MVDFQDPVARELHVARSAAAMRQWSTSLQAWSRLARERSRRIRTAPRALPVVVSRAVPPHVGRVGDPPPGSIAVSELFEILIDHHGFGAREAVTALIVGLGVEGYPADSDVVTVSDGLDIVERILNSH